MTKDVIKKIISNLKIQNVCVHHQESKFVLEIFDYVKTLMEPKTFSANVRLFDADSIEKIVIDEIVNFASYATITKSEVKIIMVSNFDQFSIKNQNLFLKLLEESKDTIFILFSKNLRGVLPTISSRCLMLDLNRIVYSENQKLDQNAFSNAGLLEKYKDLISTNQLETFSKTLQLMITFVGTKQADKLDYLIEESFFNEHFESLVEMFVNKYSERGNNIWIANINKMLAKYKAYSSIAGSNTSLARRALLASIGDFSGN